MPPSCPGSLGTFLEPAASPAKPLGGARGEMDRNLRVAWRCVPRRRGSRTCSAAATRSRSSPGAHPRSGRRHAHHAVGLAPTRGAQPRSSEPDQLKKLLVATHLGTGPAGVGTVVLGANCRWWLSERAELGQGQGRPTAEPVTNWQHRYLSLGGQLLGVEPHRGVEGTVQQRDVGPSVTEQSLLLPPVRTAARRPRPTRAQRQTQPAAWPAAPPQRPRRGPRASVLIRLRSR